MDRFRYAYHGPVLVFGKIVQNSWYGETLAVTPEKAKSNLAYQWKKRNGLASTAKVELPERVRLVG